MQIKKGDSLGIQDIKENIRVQAQVLAAVSVGQRQYVMVILEEDEASEALILRIQKEETDYQLLREDEMILGYGAEIGEEEWNQAAEAVEKESEYILN